jgi:copper oxidase (laccase) domain-containing protein
VFAFRDRLGRVGVAFTDRHGGTSGGPFASLNLTDATGDDPASVRGNLDRLRTTLGEPPLRLALMHQVHGADVHVVDGRTDVREVPVADALVTPLADVALVVRVADCVPVLLSDRDGARVAAVHAGWRGVIAGVVPADWVPVRLADAGAGGVAAAHAGRPGLVAGVVPATLSAMHDLGAERIRAWVGPHVCGSCYEVPDQMRADVSAVVPEADARTSWGTPALDIGAGVRAQLTAAGVEVASGAGAGSRAASRCTVEDDDLFSYRRQGRRSGRLAGVVWRRR